MLTEEQFKLIKNDSFYYPLYLKYGLAYIKEAGFFFTKLPFILNFDIESKILCTPNHHISKPTTNKSCIIVSSGSYCPVHDGHIDMMAVSKMYLESIGYEVLGGYVAPDHDCYVSRKNGDGHIPIHERSRLISEKIKIFDYQDWLAVDPWYGTFVPCDLNFTTLIERYEVMFKDLNTEIFYISGGDNCKFANTFELKGNCIIVTRGNYDISGINNSNAHIVSYGQVYSSTEARKYHNYKEHKKVDVSIRYTEIEPIINVDKYFDYIEKVMASEQLSHFNEFVQMNDLIGKVISLDSLSNTELFLRVSRKYDIFGHNKFGYIIDDSVIDKLDKNINYHLYDDDVHTGETIEYVISYLKKKGINVVNYFTMNYGTTEILDNRDLLIFWDNNGLVVDDDGLRLPYIYPFVDPYVRCSVIDPLEFSIDVWEQNMNICKKHNKKLVDTSQKEFYTSLGFTEDQYCWKICEFYWTILKQELVNTRCNCLN
ncbi:MAG: hypothetical protein WC679_02465 [Bacteroidales bacterium]|jgi:hypothetical protein